MEGYKVPQSKHKDLVVPIHTDLYQITMAYTYYKQKKHNDHAIFEAFYRKNPFDGEYTIFAGLMECLSFIQHYKFTEDQIEYLRKNLGDNLDQTFYDYLRNLDCSSLKVYAFREGSIVFPREPLIRLEGPLGLVQMLESTLLNLLGFPTLIATNASRFRTAAGEHARLMEFGLRRAQGPDGGLSCSKYSYLGGFDGTSNVLAGQLFDIPIAGTMAHSFVTSYDSLSELKKEEMELNGVNLVDASLKYREILKYTRTHEGELAAFIAFGKSLPHRFMCLVDSYDTLNSGVPNFICVALALLDAGQNPLGVRLDSGDLAMFSKKAKELFREAERITKHDLSKVVVFASDDINEKKLKALKNDKHEIDAFGIGTHLVTCQKQPALGMVYKLVELENLSRMKNSADPGKATLPGNKSVLRIWVKSAKHPVMDLITLHDEKIELEKEVEVRNLNDLHKKFLVVANKIEPQLHLVWNGAATEKVPSLKEAKEYCKAQLASFNQKVLDIEKPEAFPIMVTEKFYHFFVGIVEKNNIPNMIE